MRWLLIGSLLVVSGCSFGAYVQPLQEGSKFDVSYQKNRYQNIRSGMKYVDAKQETDIDVEASPKKGWDSWMDK